MTPTPDELTIATAAAELAGVRSVFVGIGLPNAAANLARLTAAPELELIYESGVIGAQPARLPDSIGDPVLVSGAFVVRHPARSTAVEPRPRAENL